MPGIVARQFVFICVALSFSDLQLAQTMSAIPSTVERYQSDITRVLHGASKIPLERAFEEGLLAASVLERGQLIRLDDAAYRKLRSMMPGFTIGREEVVTVAPIPDFFVRLARERGTSADRAFFSALKETYPDGVQPAYYKAQTDYGGCVDFGDGTLTRLYTIWSRFSASYPGRYEGPAHKELAAIEEATTSTCACGSESDVKHELRALQNAYGASRIGNRVASQLQAIESHTSGIEFNCRPR